MTHIELLNDQGNEQTLADLQCRRDPCHPELGGGGLTLGPPEAEEEEGQIVVGPIQPCVWP
jgi:hypothetical protein